MQQRLTSGRSDRTHDVSLLVVKTQLVDMMMCCTCESNHEKLCNSCTSRMLLNKSVTTIIQQISYLALHPPLTLGLNKRAYLFRATYLVISRLLQLFPVLKLIHLFSHVRCRGKRVYNIQAWGEHFAGTIYSVAPASKVIIPTYILFSIHFFSMKLAHMLFSSIGPVHHTTQRSHC